MNLGLGNPGWFLSRAKKQYIDSSVWWRFRWHGFLLESPGKKWREHNFFLTKGISYGLKISGGNRKEDLLENQVKGKQMERVV